MNRLAAAAVVRSNFAICAAVARAARKDFALSHHLPYQPDLLRLRRIKTTARQEQIADDGIAQVPLQARNSAVSGNQP